MLFTHSDSIWSAHPTLRALTAGLKNVRNIKNDPARMQRLMPRITQRLAAGSEAEMPEIAAWREAFSRMGLKPTQYRCASEALLRRYRKEGNVPSVHPLVDYLNFVSMAFAIPIAAFDCDKIAREIMVRLADGSETYDTFQGQVEHPQLDEVIFADMQGHAHARRWTNRQSARSAVTAQTDVVLVVAEALHPGASRDLEALEQELQSGTAEAGAQVVRSAQLGPDQRRFEI